MGDDSKALVITKNSNVQLQLASNPQYATAYPKPKPEVLEEEQYVEAIEEIIKRDFYPDLPKLRNQLEWLEAERNGDISKMREIQQRLKSQGVLSGSVRGTPSTFERMTPSSFTPSKNAPNPQATPSSQPSSNPPPPSTDNDGEKPTIDTTNLRLDNFHWKYTSEDNASFKEIIDKQNERKKEKYWYLAQTEKESQAMITGGDPNANRLLTWGYTAKNQLMYNPDGVAPTDKEIRQATMGPPKAVEHQNTRFHITKQPQPTTQSQPQDPQFTYAMLGQEERVLMMRRAQKDAKIDLDELRGLKTPTIPQSPQVGGFGFVATPSPAPGVDASPFITWGSIEGTPLLLDSDTPYSSHVHGPTFKVPETPKREAVAMKLAENAKKSKSAEKPRKAPKLHTPSPLLDKQLRASYSSPLARATPSPLKRSAPSPLHTLPSPAKSTKIHVMQSPSIQSSKKGSSITDNLLNLPTTDKSSSGGSLTDGLLKI